MKKLCAIFSCFAFINQKFAQTLKYFAQLCDCMIAAFRNSVSVVLQGCYRAVIKYIKGVLQMCHEAVTRVIKAYYRGGTKVSQGCHKIVT